LFEGNECDTVAVHCNRIAEENFHVIETSV